MANELPLTDHPWAPENLTPAYSGANEPTKRHRSSARGPFPVVIRKTGGRLVMYAAISVMPDTRQRPGSLLACRIVASAVDGMFFLGNKVQFSKEKNSGILPSGQIFDVASGKVTTPAREVFEGQSAPLRQFFGSLPIDALLANL